MPDYVSPPFDIPSALLVQLQQMQELFQVGREAHALGTTIHDAVPDDQPLGSDLRLVAYFLFAKGFKSFQSVWNLCLCGCGSDALSLCGSLFEIVVDLQYIRMAPRLRARKFIQFEQVEKYRSAKKVLERKRLPKGMRKKFQRFLADLAADVKYTDKLFPPKTANWSGKQIRQRAHAVKMDLLYDTLYSITCAHKHNSPSSASGVVVRDASCDYVVVGPNIKGVFVAASNAVHLFLDLCGIFQDVYQLGMEANVLALKARVERSVRDTLATVDPQLCE